MKKAVSAKRQAITRHEYSDLVPAIADYRQSLKEYSGFSSDNYHRIFTESRVNGLRSKFWLSRASDRQMRKLKHFVKSNPFVVAGNSVYRVKLKTVAPSYSPYTFRGWGDGDLALYANRVLTA